MRFVKKLVKKILPLVFLPVLFLFTVYWFDLDKKLLTKFEPTFREMADMVKQMKAARAE